MLDDRSRSLWIAYQRTRKDRAVGVDGQTAQEYAQELGKHLGSLLKRLKSGTYRAPAVWPPCGAAFLLS